MAAYPLSERQKELLRSLPEGLINQTIETEWTVQYYIGEKTMFIYGINDREVETLWRTAKQSDLQLFARCGFMQCTRIDEYGNGLNWVLYEYSIVEAVKNNFEVADDRPSEGVHINTLTVTGMVNINSTLDNVNQVIESAPNLPADFRVEFEALIERLKEDLVDVPIEDSEVITEQAGSIANQLARKEPNRKLIQFSAATLRAAAENIAQIAAPVVSTVTLIIETLRKAGFIQ